MPLTDARDFFGSQAFSNYRNSLEGRQKVTMAILSRFDNVMKGMNSLSRALARRR
jgi:hypothetical protein